MIGLEFICKVFKKENKELAEKLKISAPNISGWIKGTREIPTKYLSQLSKIFNGLSIEYFQKELTYLDELKIRIYYIEKGLTWDERHGELTVHDLDKDNEIIMDEYIDDYGDELEQLYAELNNTLKLNSYNDQIKYVFEQLSALSNEQKTEKFGNNNPDDFIVDKLKTYMTFIAKFETNKINLIDTIMNYLVSYHGLELSEWKEQALFPNEKMLSFYSDLEEVFKKHQVLYVQLNR